MDLHILFNCLNLTDGKPKSLFSPTLNESVILSRKKHRRTFHKLVLSPSLTNIYSTLMETAETAADAISRALGVVTMHRTSYPILPPATGDKLEVSPRKIPSCDLMDVAARVNLDLGKQTEPEMVNKWIARGLRRRKEKLDERSCEDVGRGKTSSFRLICVNGHY